MRPVRSLNAILTWETLHKRSIPVMCRGLKRGKKVAHARISLGAQPVDNSVDRAHNSRVRNDLTHGSRRLVRTKPSRWYSRSAG